MKPFNATHFLESIKMKPFLQHRKINPQKAKQIIFLNIQSAYTFIDTFMNNFPKI